VSAQVQTSSDVFTIQAFAKNAVMPSCNFGLNLPSSWGLY